MSSHPFIGERLTENELEQMIREADMNGDNVINFEGAF